MGVGKSNAFDHLEWLENDEADFSDINEPPITQEESSEAFPVLPVGSFFDPIKQHRPTAS